MNRKKLIIDLIKNGAVTLPLRQIKQELWKADYPDLYQNQDNMRITDELLRSMNIELTVEEFGEVFEGTVNLKTMISENRVLRSKKYYFIGKEFDGLLDKEIEKDEEKDFESMIKLREIEPFTGVLHFKTGKYHSILVDFIPSKNVFSMTAYRKLEKDEIREVNFARSLTPEQRQDKGDRKYIRDTSTRTSELLTSVYAFFKVSDYDDMSKDLWKTLNKGNRDSEKLFKKVKAFLMFASDLNRDSFFIEKIDSRKLNTKTHNGTTNTPVDKYYLTALNEQKVRERLVELGCDSDVIKYAVRSGHIRNQPYGKKGNPDYYRKIYINPTIIKLQSKKNAG